MLTSCRQSRAAQTSAQEASDRPRKRSLDDMNDLRPSRKRSRSVSTYSSASVSTISTRSPSRDGSGPRPSTERNLASQRRDRDISATGGAGDKRRRPSSTASSSDHLSSYESQRRNTRMRRNSRSPSERGRRRGRSARSERRMRSASAKDNTRDARGLTPIRRTDPGDRPRMGQRNDMERPDYNARDQDREMRDVPSTDSRPRSLSPFSKRVALTQSINR